MTARDRTVLLVVAVIGIVVATWFLALSPKRKDAKDLDAQISAAQTQLASAQAVEAAGAAAQADYKKNYATVARLGKAVPADDDVPSLLLGLQGASNAAKVDFRSIALSTNSVAATPAANNAAAIASASGTSGATGATGAVPATQMAAADLPPGAAVGAAGFPTLPFDFKFNGDFFRLEDILHQLDDFTKVDGQKVTVGGRLLTVDGFSLQSSSRGFPHMTASVHATAYVVPTDQGATAGATPAGPGAAATTTIPTGATP